MTTYRSCKCPQIMVEEPKSATTELFTNWNHSACCPYRRVRRRRLDSLHLYQSSKVLKLFSTGVIDYINLLQNPRILVKSQEIDMASLRRNYFRDLPVARALVEKAKGKTLLTVTASQVSGSRKPLNLTLADPLQKSLSGLPSLAHTAY